MSSLSWGLTYRIRLASETFVCTVFWIKPYALSARCDMTWKTIFSDTIHQYFDFFGMCSYMILIYIIWVCPVEKVFSILLSGKEYTWQQYGCNLCELNLENSYFVSIRQK